MRAANPSVHVPRFPSLYHLCSALIINLFGWDRPCEKRKMHLMSWTLMRVMVVGIVVTGTCLMRGCLLQSVW